MGTMASQLTSLTIVYSTVYSGADQRKHQSSVSLAFVRGIHRWPVSSPHKWPATRKSFPLDDVIMKSQDSETTWDGEIQWKPFRFIAPLYNKATGLRETFFTKTQGCPNKVNPGYFSLAATARKPQQLSMFLHTSARVWGRRWSPHTSEQKGSMLKPR